MDCVICTIELCVMPHIFFCRKSNCYIFFAGYSFVIGVFSRESETHELNDGNYLVYC